MGAADVIARLTKLRELRVRKDEAPVIGVQIAREADELSRLEKKLGGAGAAWAGVCPAALCERAVPVSLSRGTLQIEVRDAAARYEVDRWLRGGGEARLVAASAAPIRRVRIVLGRGA